MEFGRIDINELEKADLRLPAEPESNKSILTGKQLSPKVYVGCSKWGRTEWVGKLYPVRTKERDFLQHYVTHYNSVELNATHYKIIGETGIGAWKKKADRYDFRFCPKMYKGITHAGKLNDKPFIINEFLRGIKAFGDKLGPVFIQLHERFSPNRKDELFDFLEKLPRDMSFFLELRHEKWFTPEQLGILLPFLQDRKIGFVITDTAGRRDCCHMHLTLPVSFIRFVGNSLHPTDFTRIDEWGSRIHSWLEQGIHEIYFMIHSGDEAASPELSRYVIDRFNQTCNLHLPPVQFVSDSRSGKF